MLNYIHNTPTVYKIFYVLCEGFVGFFRRETLERKLGKRTLAFHFSKLKRCCYIDCQQLLFKYDLTEPTILGLMKMKLKISMKKLRLI